MPINFCLFRLEHARLLNTFRLLDERNNSTKRTYARKMKTQLSRAHGHRFYRPNCIAIRKNNLHTHTPNVGSVPAERTVNVLTNERVKRAQNYREHRFFCCCASSFVFVYNGQLDACACLPAKTMQLPWIINSPEASCCLSLDFFLLFFVDSIGCARECLSAAFIIFRFGFQLVSLAILFLSIDTLSFNRRHSIYLPLHSASFASRQLILTIPLLHYYYYYYY